MKFPKTQLILIGICTLFCLTNSLFAQLPTGNLSLGVIDGYTTSFGGTNADYLTGQDAHYITLSTSGINGTDYIYRYQGNQFEQIWRDRVGYFSRTPKLIKEYADGRLLVMYTNYQQTEYTLELVDPASKIRTVIYSADTETDQSPFVTTWGEYVLFTVKNGQPLLSVNIMESGFPVRELLPSYSNRNIDAGDRELTDRLILYSGTTLYGTDGTPEGTEELILNLGSSPQFKRSGQLFYVNSNGLLSATDGTSDGTVQLTHTDGISENWPNNQYVLRAVTNGVVFMGNSVNNGLEVWTSNGTPTGTGILEEFVTGPESSLQTSFIDLYGAGHFGFRVNLGPESDKIYITDGNL